MVWCAVPRPFVMKSADKHVRSKLLETMNLIHSCKICASDRPSTFVCASVRT